MNNINKKLMAIFVGSFMLLATVAVAVPADVSAQTADDSQPMSQQDRERLDNIQNGLSKIMDKYGVTEGAPQVSRSDWTAMQGEIYDLFNENNINPVTAMKYMYGKKMDNSKQQTDNQYQKMDNNPDYQTN